MSGYMPKRRTKVVTADWEVDEGVEPFQATIVTSLTFEEIDAISLTDETTYGELFTRIAPYVVAWNAMGRNSETGEYELLPPPAEAGPDVLKKVEGLITTWLALKLRRVHLGDDTDPKGETASTPSEPTPDGKQDGNSSSPTPVSARKSRTDTT
jgi:hypothetical protein